MRSPQQAMATWPYEDATKPLDFIAQENGTCLVTLSQSYLNLKPNESITVHQLEGIKELLQLHPWKEQCLLLAVPEDQTQPTAYQVDALYPLSKHHLEELPKPKMAVYSILNNVIYYINNKNKLYQYHLTDKTNTPLLEEHSFTTIKIAAKGHYLALESTATVQVMKVDEQGIMQHLELPKEQECHLIGVTDGSRVLVTAQQQVHVLDGQAQQALVPCSSGWARWHAGYLLTLHEGEFQLYNQQTLRE